MKQKILFRADSSSSIGLGHIMRDLVLASQFKNSNITFATQDLQGNINYKIVDAGYNLEILKSDNKKELFKLIKKLHIDLLVIDSYKINYKQENYLKNKTGVKIFVLDDTYEKHNCDILLNHNISANPEKYKDLIPKDCELRCGSNYTLLRDEFYKEKKKSYQRDAKTKTIFVAMGGSDHSNINIKILKILKKFNIKVNIVTTIANKNLKALKKYVKDKNWIHLHIDSKEIAKLIAESDGAIVSPSVSVNEVDFMGLELIAVQTATNQKDIYDYLTKNNYLTLKKFNKKELRRKVKILLRTIKKPKKIELLNFTELNLEEKKMVLDWRNHKGVKRWMYNNKDISLESHLEFIESLKYTKNKLYFLVKQNHKYIGVIDFTSITKKSAEFGLYANVGVRGVGSLLLDSICKYGFKDLKLQKLIAQVFVTNKRAINLYKSFNFKEVDKKTVHCKKVIQMELENENR